MKPKFTHLFKLNKINLFLLIILIFLLVCLIFNLFIVQDIIVLSYSARADDTLGFNLTNLDLNFGRVYPGGIAIKTIVLDSKEKSYVKIISSGLGSENLVYSNNNFVFQGEREVNITYVMPPNTKIGEDYNGNVKFVFFRTLF
ncbi:hypothetical protein J4403_02925 [Candidatus Woesearchaeota archaeon]|nr:hypothetical protein [Candidatus Woesearchaeota archaeon]